MKEATKKILIFIAGVITGVFSSVLFISILFAIALSDVNLVGF